MFKAQLIQKLRNGQKKVRTHLSIYLQLHCASKPFGDFLPPFPAALQGRGRSLLGKKEATRYIDKILRFLTTDKSALSRYIDKIPRFMTSSLLIKDGKDGKDGKEQCVRGWMSEKTEKNSPTRSKNHGVLHAVQEYG